jgi:mRNA interferase RelE/StbE
MTWRVEIKDTARKELRRLDLPVQRRLLGFLRERVATGEDPTRLGKALHGPLGGTWRYRVGDYRLICRIEHATETVWVLKIALRDEVYRR